MNTQTIIALCEKTRELDLAITTLRTLCILAEEGAQTMTDLARKLGLETASTTVVARRLELLRYAIRKHGSKDRRVVRISITDHGRNALNDIITAAAQEACDAAA